VFSDGFVTENRFVAMRWHPYGGMVLALSPWCGLGSVRPPGGSLPLLNFDEPSSGSPPAEPSVYPVIVIENNVALSRKKKYSRL
jgi:hypothetical protein